MRNKLFNQCLGKTAKKEECSFDLTKDLLVVDKNKQSQVKFFNKIINNLLDSKEDLQIALIDYENKNYKEFEDNEKMFPPIAHNKEDAKSMLNFITMTQKARISLLKQCNVRNVEEYNEKEKNKLSYIFIFIDELSYLMQDEQIKELLSLLPLNRSCGIYLLVGTSSVFIERDKVLTGEVKANFLNRVCFAVDTKQESKLVIDDFGAENLLRENNEIILSEASGNRKVVLDLSNEFYCKDIKDYQNYLFFDIETTGLNAETDEIIKFYYVLTDNKMNIINKVELFVNTGKTVISKKITEITGIKQKDIINGIYSQDLVNLLREIINSDTLLIFYNVPFTMSFITIFLNKMDSMEILNGVDYLDLLDVFRFNEKGQKSYRIKNAVKFYKIREKNIEGRETEIYSKLFKKMMKKYDLKLFVRNNF